MKSEQAGELPLPLSFVAKEAGKQAVKLLLAIWLASRVLCELHRMEPALVCECVCLCCEMACDIHIGKVMC